MSNNNKLEQLEACLGPSAQGVGDCLAVWDAANGRYVVFEGDSPWAKAYVQLPFPAYCYGTITKENVERFKGPTDEVCTIIDPGNYLETVKLCEFLGIENTPAFKEELDKWWQRFIGVGAAEMYLAATTLPKRGEVFLWRENSLACDAAELFGETDTLHPVHRTLTNWLSVHGEAIVLLANPAIMGPIAYFTYLHFAKKSLIAQNHGKPLTPEQEKKLKDNALCLGLEVCVAAVGWSLGYFLAPMILAGLCLNPLGAAALAVYLILQALIVAVTQAIAVTCTDVGYNIRHTHTPEERKEVYRNAFKLFVSTLVAGVVFFGILQIPLKMKEIYAALVRIAISSIIITAQFFGVYKWMQKQDRKREQAALNGNPASFFSGPPSAKTETLKPDSTPQGTIEIRPTE